MMDAFLWTTAAAAAEQGGDSSSTEEVESPRSVVTAAAISAARRGSGRWRLWRKSCNSAAAGERNVNQKEKEKEKDKEEEKACLHIQVLRLKEEELQISEDLIGDHYTCYDYVADCHPLDDDLWCRSNLPASPLGSKRVN